MKQAGVYRIRNNVTGGLYIGSTTNLKRRALEHRRYLNAGRHHCSHLQNAWNKYSGKVFTFEPIEIVSIEEMTKKEAAQELLAHEQYWFNLAKEGALPVYTGRQLLVSSNYGCKQSEASNKKRSLAMKGRGVGILKTAREDRFCACGCGTTFRVKVTSKRRYIFEHVNLGRKASESTRRKISERQIGHRNYRPGMPSPNKGKPSPYKGKTYKTHCKRGHLRSKENLSGKHCRTCQRQRQLQHRDRYNANRRMRNQALRFAAHGQSS